MGHERAHAEFFSQSEGLSVVVFGLLDLWGLTLRGDVAEKSKGPGLMCPSYVRVGEPSTARPATWSASSSLPAKRQASLSQATQRGKLPLLSEVA